MSRREGRYRRQAAGAQAMLARVSPAERAVLLPDANPEQCGVEDAEDQGDLPEAEHQRQDGGLANNDEVIRVVQEAVRPLLNERGVVDDDDPRRPAWAQRNEDPDSCGLQKDEHREPEGI